MFILSCHCSRPCSVYLPYLASTGVCEALSVVCVRDKGEAISVVARPRMTERPSTRDQSPKQVSHLVGLLTYLFNTEFTCETVQNASHTQVPFARVISVVSHISPPLHTHTHTHGTRNRGITLLQASDGPRDHGTSSPGRKNIWNSHCSFHCRLRLYFATKRSRASSRLFRTGARALFARLARKGARESIYQGAGLDCNTMLRTGYRAISGSHQSFFSRSNRPHCVSSGPGTNVVESDDFCSAAASLEESPEVLTG